MIRIITKHQLDLKNYLRCAAQTCLIIFSLQTTTTTVTDPEDPVDVPVPSDFGPVTDVVIEVTVTKDGQEKTPPTSVEVVIKGCLKGKKYNMTIYLSLYQNLIAFVYLHNFHSQDLLSNAKSQTY